MVMAAARSYRSRPARSEFSQKTAPLSKGAPFCYHGIVIYLFHGSDVDKVRAKTFAWVKAAREKEPNLSYVRLSKEEMTDAVLSDAALAGGLFVRKLLVLIDDPFSGDREAADAGRVGALVEASLDMFAKSDNVIVMLAPKLAEPKAKKIASYAAKVYRVDLSAARGASRGFNSALVNALAARDARALWLEIVRALHAGDAPEMVHGLLHWKARDLMQKGPRAWPSADARGLSLRLIELLVVSRRKGLDLGRELERFALQI